MEADPEIRIREIRFFRKFFWLLRTSWDLRVTPRMVRNHLIRIRTGKSGFSKIQIFRFFENPDFSIFRLFKLKDPKTWVSIDSPGCFLLIALLNCPLNKLINFGGYDLYIISTEYYPSEPERAAEARRAVVASAFLFSFNSGTYHIFIGINF